MNSIRLTGQRSGGAEANPILWVWPKARAGANIITLGENICLGNHILNHSFLTECYFFKKKFY